MKLKVTPVDVWAVSIKDRVGGLAEKLAALTAAGSNLEFVIARRAPEQPGRGVVFVTPLKGAKQVKAAEAAGFLMTGSLHSVRIEGADKPGLGAKMTKALSEAGINLRGLSAAGVGTKFVCYLALDTPEDARKATDILKKLR
jgi:hypothetical protein